MVFGATGLQGGPVARAILQNPKYKVKAVTRNPESEKAKLLTTEGKTNKYLLLIYVSKGRYYSTNMSPGWNLHQGHVKETQVQRPRLGTMSKANLLIKEGSNVNNVLSYKILRF